MASIPDSIMAMLLSEFRALTNLNLQFHCKHNFFRVPTKFDGNKHTTMNSILISTPADAKITLHLTTGEGKTIIWMLQKSGYVLLSH